MRKPNAYTLCVILLILWSILLLAIWIDERVFKAHFERLENQVQIEESLQPSSQKPIGIWKRVC